MKTLHLTFTLTKPAPPPPPPPPPVDNNLWFLEHEWPPRDSIQQTSLGGFPQTCKTLDDHWEKLDASHDAEGRNREQWWFEMFKACAPVAWQREANLATLKRKWEGYLDSGLAWTNGHGTDKYRSDVLGTFQNEDYIAQETLVCKGNVVRVVGEPILRMGESWYPVQAIDSTSTLPPWETVLATPWLCHTSVILYKDGHTSHFPHLDGNMVPLPVVIKGGVMYIASYANIGGARQRVMRKLEPGEAIPSPIRGPR